MKLDYEVAKGFSNLLQGENADEKKDNQCYVGRFSTTMSSWIEAYT